MKKVLHISMLIFALALTACNQKRPAQRISSRDGSPIRGPVDSIGGQNPANMSASCGSNCAWGKMYEDSAGDFEARVKSFGSVSVPVEEIGQIDYSLNGTETGVWFWGDVSLQGGTLRTLATGTTQSLSVGSNSKLAVVIYDSHTMTSGVSPIASLFSGSTGGQVSGSIERTASAIRGQFQFRDQWGTITLVGEVVSQTGSLDQAMFTGEAKFTNTCSMNPDSGQCDRPSMASGDTRLGKFTVEACRFFSCQ
jgi:hypothetical protein